MAANSLKAMLPEPILITQKWRRKKFSMLCAEYNQTTHPYATAFGSVIPVLQPDHFKCHGYGPDTKFDLCTSILHSTFCSMFLHPSFTITQCFAVHILFDALVLHSIPLVASFPPPSQTQQYHFQHEQAPPQEQWMLQNRSQMWSTCNSSRLHGLEQIRIMSTPTSIY